MLKCLVTTALYVFKACYEIQNGLGAYIEDAVATRIKIGTHL